MHFYKNNLNFYFVHIPRTGGRYVKKLLLLNKFKSNFNCEGHVKYKGIEIMHLQHELLIDFHIYKQSKKFTIVRNPLSRFISATNIDLNLNPFFKCKLNTVNQVLDYITYQQNGGSFHNNWFKPQYEFISEDCLVWKFENGFNKNFKTFLLDKLNININNYNFDWKDDFNKKPCFINFNMEIIQKAVSIAYKIDYDKFY